MKLVLVFLFLTTVIQVFGQLPGFKTTLSENGLNYVRQVGVELLEQSISTLQIPDISGTTSNLFYDLI